MNLDNTNINSEQLYHYIFDAIKDGLWDWNILTNEVYFNAVWFTMLGYSPNEMPASFETWENLVHPDDINITKDMIIQHINSKKNYNIEFRMRMKDGNYKWILGRGKIVEYDENGNGKRMVGTHTDIDNIKKNEFELENTKLHLSSILDSMPSILCVLDKNMIIKNWNLHAESKLNISKENAIGKNILEVIPYFKDNQIYNDMLDSKNNSSSIFRERIQISKMSQAFYNIVIYPLNYEFFSDLVIRIDDVTEKVYLEEMMMQTEKMMSVGGLAAGMAHEINNPLGVILQGIQNTLRRISPDLQSNIEVANELNVDLEKIIEYLNKRRITHYLEGIHLAGLRASKIVKNMLQFSRRSDSKIAPNNINDIIEASIELAENDYNLKKRYDFRHIIVNRNFTESLQPVKCTRTEIEQVFLNILRNAAQAMPQDKIHTPEISISTAIEKNYCVITFTDNGIGIDKENLRRIFEPFYTTKAPGIGTGLGLSVSYFIITSNHKGLMTVESIVNQGTTFTIKLPV